MIFYFISSNLKILKGFKYDNEKYANFLRRNVSSSSSKLNKRIILLLLLKRRTILFQNKSQRLLYSLLSSRINLSNENSNTNWLSTLFKIVLTIIFYPIMRMKQMFTFYKKRFWLITNLKASIFLIIYIINYSNWILINVKIYSISSFILKAFISTFSIYYYILNWKSTFSFFYFISTWIRSTMIISFIIFKIINR